jgi:hypothetical protein
MGGKVTAPEEGRAARCAEPGCDRRVVVRCAWCRRSVCARCARPAWMADDVLVCVACVAAEAARGGARRRGAPGG